MPKDQNQLDIEKTQAADDADSARQKAEKSAKAAEEKQARARSVEETAASAREDLKSLSQTVAELELLWTARADVDGRLQTAREDLSDDVEENETPPTMDERARLELRSKYEAEAEQAKQEYEEAVARQRELEQTLESLEEEARQLASDAEEAEQTAREDETDALVAEAKASDAAEAAALGEKKVERVLAWDGLLDLDGRCNRYGDSPVAQRRAQRRSEVAKLPSKLLVRPVGAEETKSYSSTVRTLEKISVRLVSCDQTFVPAEGRLLVHAKLKRVARIKSLLFRVYDASNAVVYQERLDETQIDRLPETDNLARPHLESLDRRFGRSTGIAAPADGPFKLRLWVSDDARAFEKPTGGILDATTEPAEVLGRTMHDKSVFPTPPKDDTPAWSDIAKKLSDKKNDVSRDQKGFNQFDVKTARLATVVMPDVMTTIGRARCVRAPNLIVAEIAQFLTDANTHLGARKPGEVRLMLLPEWNFQSPNAPFTLSTAERDNIVTQLEQESARPAFQDWYLFPGTMLVHETTNHGVRPVFNFLPVLQGGNVIHRYYKQHWGSDIPKNHTYVNGLQSDVRLWVDLPAKGNERRRKKLDQGGRHVPASLCDALDARLALGANRQTVRNTATCRVVQAGAAWEIEVGNANKAYAIAQKLAPKDKNIRLFARDVFALGVAPGDWPNVFGTLARNAFVTRPFFQHDGLKFATEICADHPYGWASMQYQAGDGSGAGATDGVDIHVVSSSNTARFAFLSVARKKGLFLHADGTNFAQFAATVNRHVPVTTVGPTMQAKWDDYSQRRPATHVNDVTFAQAAPVDVTSGAVTLKVFSMLLADQ